MTERSANLLLFPGQHGAPEPAPDADSSPSLDDLLGFGHRAMQAREYDSAIAAFEAAIHIHGPSEAAYIGLVGASKESGELSTALRHARCAAEKLPGSAALIAVLAQALVDMRLCGEARALLGTAVWKYESSYTLAEIAAMLEFFAGDPFRGVDLVEEALRRGMPARPHVHWAGVEMLCLTGDFDRARQMLSSIQSPDRQSLEVMLSEREADWLHAEREWMQSGGNAQPTRQDVNDAIRSGLLRVVGMLIGKIFASNSTTSEDYIFISQSSFRLWHRNNLDVRGYIDKAISAAAQRVSPSAQAVFAFAEALIQKCCWNDAARLLLPLLWADARDVPTESLIRLIAMCHACGAVDLPEFERALDVAKLRNVDPDLIVFLEDVLRSRSAKILPHIERTGNRVDKVVRKFFVHRNHVKLQMACCISGQLRSFRKTWPATRDVLAGYDVTVFVAAWQKTGNGFGAQNNLDRVLPAEMVNHLPSILRSKTFIAENFPNLFACLATEDAVTAESLQEFYQTKHVCVLDEDAFDTEHAASPGLFADGRLNQAKMYFAMSRVLELRADFESDSGRFFDVVLRSRPDRRLEALSRADVTSASARSLYLTDHFYSWAAGDQSSLSSAAVADDIASIWPSLKNAGRFMCFRGGTGRAGEYLMGESLIRRGISFQRFEVTRFSDLVSERAEPLDVLEAVARDVASKSSLNSDDRLVISSTIRMARETHLGEIPASRRNHFEFLERMCSPA
jgi:tetratricopeptide (TPR) repeat protein